MWAFSRNCSLSFLVCGAQPFLLHGHDKVWRGWWGGEDEWLQTHKGVCGVLGAWLGCGYGVCICMCVLQLSASEPIELSRIYPTPPSVENSEGEKFEDLKMSRASGADSLVSGVLLENVRNASSEGVWVWCVSVGCGYG